MSSKILGTPLEPIGRVSLEGDTLSFGLQDVPMTYDYVLMSNVKFFLTNNLGHVILKLRLKCPK
jgi:hypothetical protein